GAGGQVGERGGGGGVEELVVLVAQLLLAPLHLLRGLTQVAHDVDHRLAAVAEPQVGLVRVLEDVQQRTAGVVEALGLAGEPAAVVLVVAEDVEHRLALVGELLVRLVQVTHDVNERAPAFLGELDPRLKLLDLGLERGEVGLGPALARAVRWPPGLRAHQAEARAAFSFSLSRRKSSSSFSSAIIFSSRPTTTSSNFSRSRIFSWSSVFDRSRSLTTSS